MGATAGDDVAFVAQALGRCTQSVAEVAQVLTTAVAQFDMLQIVPNTLVRIEIRGIAGQAFQMEACGGPLAQEVLDGLGAVNRSAIPDDEELAGDVAQQMAQKAHDIRAFVGALLLVQEEASVGCNGADDGEVVSRERSAQNGRLSTWSVGAHDTREEVEARFIHPHDRPSLFPGLLF